MCCYWSIKLVICVLLLLQTVQKISSYFCIQSESKVEVPVDDSEPEDYPFYYNPLTEWVIETVTITCSNVSDVTAVSMKHFHDQKYKQFLNIIDSNVSTIPPSAFARFYPITRLYLSGIHIEDIYPEAFKNLTRLQQLHLDKNELTILSNNVYNTLKQLEVLNLANNKIQQIEKNALTGIDKLMELYLNDNEIGVLDDGVFKTFQYLKILDLSGNPLVKVDNWNIPSLENLSLSRLSLSDFNVNLSNSSVKFMNLSSNQLSTVDFIAHLPPTQRLDLSRNQIVSIENLTTSIGGWVSFDNNRILTVRGHFPLVTELYLSHNQIKILEGSPFDQSKTLIILDCGFNSISKMDASVFSGLLSLEQLLLHHNNLSKIELGTFHSLIALSILDLSHNNLEQFQFGIFDSLRTLRTLDISHNKLKDLNQYTFNALTVLSNLYFDNNKISSFDVKYLTEHHAALNRISLDQNPWSCQDLVKIEHVLRSRKVYIKVGESYDVENFHGIACVNRKEFEEHHNTSAHFQRALTRGMENFLSQELKNSKLFHYFTGKHDNNEFSDFLAAEKLQLERISSNKGLMVVNALQVVISCLTLVLICFIAVYLRKVRLQRRSECSSQMELF